MQASKIIIGQDYAIKAGSHGVTAGKAMALTTFKTTSGTTNSVTFRLDKKDEAGHFIEVTIAVDAVIDELKNHRELQAAKEAEEAKRKAIEADRKATQMLAIKLLAKAIGAQAVEDRYARGGSFKRTFDNDLPAVLVEGTGIEINEAAFDNIIEYFKGHGEEEAA